MSDGKVFGFNEETDEWNEATYKKSWWIDDQLVGITSSRNFVPHEFSEITEFTADAVESLKEEHDFNFKGVVETSPTFHRYTNEGLFDGIEINPGESDDPSTVGIKVTSGNDGRKATEGTYYEERQVCSNGLTMPVDQMSVRQTHHEPLDPTMFHKLASSVVENADTVESRYDQMKEIELDSPWTAFEFLEHRLNIPFYIEGDHAEVAQTYDEVVEEKGSPTVYEVLQTATQLLTHNARDDLPKHVLNSAEHRAAELADFHGSLPDYELMAERTIEDRMYELMHDDEVEEYWEGEEQHLEELAETYEVTV